VTRISIFLLLLVATAAHAGTAFFLREHASATTRICYYEYLGTEYAITVPLMQFCPLTIEVE
jgi:hypothetical protein